MLAKTWPSGPQNNIVVITPGSTGSRLLVEWLEVFGWNCPLKDKFGEPPAFRQCNVSMLKGRKVDPSSLIDSLKEPWVLKDPRLTDSKRLLDYWRACLPGDFEIVLNMRSYQDHMRSYRRRWKASREKIISRRKLAASIYKEWDGKKSRLDYETIKRACDVWSPVPADA